MFLIKSEDHTAVVPGFLLGYRGDAMMPEYSRHKATLPVFLLAGIGCAIMCGYALFKGEHQQTFMAFCIFMATFSARMFTQRLIRVNFATAAEAQPAPLPTKLDNLLTALNLLMLGIAFIRLTGNLSSFLFQALGVSMIGLAIPRVLALHRRRKK
ncbi:hypothetical protein EN794_039290 [Mesorhizobium sp. M00.F.Ca.ET.151.01.1.1]|nr:hypothetical protein EN842_33700 [bacterium M00.F.Ca.ET.199.01.1.1]TGT02967.1 hypothetical protein EN820_22110 [bacterium M00.F.Ca.ET.177.01.1.1]TGT57903.1 hypothetical protein EN813_035180 [Mesorhizobium sp. M00.F.Ca.ET.170.01.1.1]TGU06816.1 hypothetical protein EN806_32970 [bacterium M00.F.Ca.ET.163.01.1.1]TGU91517.1 hypothetical protein EN794_039290 [Mesorhizobium sp. M00.F.Ca.ET.151.01.1.1]TGV53205.1 hypothetical protein EN784_40815 [bacterium M00.F.Ca.ET.141.01.1.1]